MRISRWKSITAAVVLLLCFVCPTAVLSEQQWSETPPDTVCITKTQYRRSVREIASGSDSVMPGWELYYDELGAWGDWISNGTTPIAADTYREVRTVNHPAVTQTTYSYSRYIYYNSSNGKNYLSYSSGYADSMGYQGYWETTTTSSPLAYYKMYDGVQAYGSSSSFWFYQTENTRVVSQAYTEYQYRTRARIYYFYRWSDWSAWQDAVIAADENTKVETRTLYAPDKTRPASSIVMGDISYLPMAPDMGCQLRYSATNAGVEWTSSNTDVATVDQHGFVSVHDVGMALIIANEADESEKEILIVSLEREGAKFPKKLTAIQQEAFLGDDFDYLDLKNTSVVSIGDRAFSENDRLRMVLVGDQLLDIADTAFDACDNVVMACASDGYAAEYARNNHIPYYVISDAVAYIPMTDIALGQSELSLTVGKNALLQANAVPSDATEPSIYFVSSNESVASVSADGTVHAVSPGTAVITVYSEHSGIYKSCTVSVKPVYVTGIALSQTSLSIVSGKTASLTATVTPVNAACKTIEWRSSNSSVAVVNNRGVVTGVNAGSVVITALATDGSGIQAACQVTVRADTAIDNSKFVNVYVDGITQADATIHYSMPLPKNPVKCGFYIGTTAANMQLAYEEDLTGLDYKVVSVWYNMNKRYAVLAPGTTYFYQFFMVYEDVTYKSSIYTFTTLQNTSILIENSMAATGSGHVLNIGEGETFKPTVTYTPSTATVTWSSSNPEVAYYENGVIKAVDGGSALITVAVSHAGKTVSATYNVNVNPIEYHVVIFGFKEIIDYTTLDNSLKQAAAELFSWMFGKEYIHSDLIASEAHAKEADGLAQVMRYRATLLKEKPDVHFFENISKKELINAVSEAFESSDYNDINVFYYGGHGSLSTHYLSPRDGERISPAELRAVYNGIEGHNVLILNSCYSGTYVNFANSLQNKKFYVLTACEADTRSGGSRFYEYQYTHFGEAMLEGLGYDPRNKSMMSKMKADANSDNKITLNELYNYIAPRVKQNALEYQGIEQIVQKSWLNGDFVIYQRGK